MAVSTLDPTFGQAGFVLGPLATGSGTDLSSATAVAVQADGKVVVAGTYGQAATTSPQDPNLAVHRYNGDGSVDASFGTNGQVNIPIPASSTGTANTPSNIVIEPNGTIVLAGWCPAMVEFKS